MVSLLRSLDVFMWTSDWHFTNIALYCSNVGTNLISSRHLLLLLRQQFAVPSLLWNDCSRYFRAQALSTAAYPCHCSRIVFSVCCWAFHCLAVWLDLEVLSRDTGKWQIHLPRLAWWLCGFVRRSTGFAGTMCWKCRCLPPHVFVLPLFCCQCHCYECHPPFEQRGLAR